MPSKHLAPKGEAPMMPRLTNVPAVVESEIVGTIVHWIDRVAVLLTSEANRQRLREEIKERLRDGTIATAKVIAAAEAGHQDADRRCGSMRPSSSTRAGKQNCWRRSGLCREVAATSARHLSARPQPRRYLAARHRHRRDGRLAAKRWWLSPTRNRTTPEPSAAYFVGIALRRKGFKLQEARVNRIYWEHNKLAARLSPLIPSPF